jgi:hypothetical protein
MKAKILNNPKKYLTRSDIERQGNRVSYRENIKLSKICNENNFSSELIDSNFYSTKKQRAKRKEL